MPMKFALLIDVDLWKKVTSLNTKPEVVLSRCDRHLEIVYDVITLPRASGPIERNLGRRFRIARKILRSGQNRKGKKSSNMADVCFSKPEVVISQSWITIPRRNLVCR